MGASPRDRALVAAWSYADRRARRRGTATSADEQVARPLAQRRGGVPARWVAPPGPRTAVVSEHELGDGASLRLYRAPTAAAGSPALLWVHGGGWCTGSPDGLDGFFRRTADLLGLVVGAVTYRLAPEHPFPAAYDDTCAALDALLDRTAPSRLVLAGDSAGGNLAAAVALSRRETPGLVGQVLVYPAVDLALDGDWERGWAGPGLSLDDCRRLVAHYAAGSDVTDPRLSPLRAGSLAGAPPALVVCGDLDVLRDQGRRYAERLRADGVEARHVELPGMPHGFFGGPRLLHGARRAQRVVHDQLRSWCSG